MPTEIRLGISDTMIPYGRQDISQADIDAVVDVLHSDWLTQGPMVPRFEQAVSEYAGAAHAVAVNSATSALHIACLALGVGPGDWVWTSPNTFVASSNAALYCGAHVDFVDIDPRTYNMSLELLEKKLQEAKTDWQAPEGCHPGSLCRAALWHACFLPAKPGIWFSGSSRMPPTRSAASYYDIKVGSCTHSDITVFSFHPVKIITTGEGGMALTNDADLAEQLTRYRSHGITSKTALMQPRPTDEIWNYQQIELGFNYRMTDIQAALGISQLQRLDEFVKGRHAIARRYNEAFADLPVITPGSTQKITQATTFTRFVFV